MVRALVSLQYVLKGPFSLVVPDSVGNLDLPNVNTIILPDRRPSLVVPYSTHYIRLSMSTYNIYHHCNINSLNPSDNDGSCTVRQ